MGSSDEVGVEISEDHQHVFSASWTSILSLVILFVGFYSDVNRSVWLEGSILVLLSVNKSDSVSFQDHKRLVRNWSSATVLEFESHLTTVGSDFVSTESLRHTPIESISVRL